jgi:hypothetical protein
VLQPRQRRKLAWGTEDKEHAMSQILNAVIAVVGIDIGKNSFHIVGHDVRGTIVLRQKWSKVHRLSRACRPYATPSSSSSFDLDLSAVPTAEDKSAKRDGVNKSAKVVLDLQT